MRKGTIYIGTSGWSYSHWQGIFYPENLELKNYLFYYSQHFQTVEINSSFYHLPKENTFKSWALKVPPDFLFSIKVWRRITHLKKLKDIKDDLNIFLKRAKVLGEKFGPLLFQFPPNFQATEENIKRLEWLGKFIREIRGIFVQISERQNLRKFAKGHFALEFRHQSWFTPKIYQILKKYNIALCWADTPIYPYQEEFTADYVYIRLHGHEQLYASKYTKKQLLDYAQKIKKLARQNKTVYVYFDNDACGYAIENAKKLKEMIVRRL